MSKTLDIVMSLKDQVSPNLSKMNSNLQITSGKLNAVGKSVGKLGSLLKGAFIGGAIAKFSMDALKAYDVQIQSEKSVQRALVATGKTAAQVSQELEGYKKFASKQQDITAFGDESTLQVISGLISQGFGKKSIEDIVAMSQDIARSTGDEQQNVTKALSAYVKTGKGATKLAKAYKLNADLLGKGTTESERLAEVWKAFSQSNHLGASTEYMKTFEGQLQGVQGRLDDMKEPAGELINILLGGNDQGLSGAAGAMASLQKALSNATTDMQSIANRSKDLGGGISGIMQASAEAHPVVATFFAMLVTGKTITALATLGTSLSTVASGISTLGTIAAGATTTVWGLFAAATALGVALAEVIAKIGGYYEKSANLRAQLDADQQAANGAFASTPEMYQGKTSIFDKQEASGTNYFEGSSNPVLVGEYGPELVNLPRGSSVKTNSQTQRELSGSGNNVTVNVNVAGNVIGNQDFIDQVGDAITGRVSMAIANI